jgi:alpha-tubulin suppressor-like RCC1 family protein
MKTILLNTASALLLFLPLTVPAPTQAAPTVTQVSTKYNHTLFVMSDGSLWAMGDNPFGQLGLGFGLSEINVPRQIVASNVTAVAAGTFHSLFLKSDGSLWAMGRNIYGQLGDGTTDDHYFPEPIVAGGVTTFCGGGEHSLFKTVTGHLPFLTTGLWGMGNNLDGQLGDGTTSIQHAPELLQTALFGTSSEIMDMAAGFSFSLYRRRDGSLWAMGANRSGQLGDDTISSSSSPVEIVRSGVTRIAAGCIQSLFLKSDGSLWAMGNNSNGQLGDNSVSNRFVPEQVGVSVTAIGAGEYHSLFIKSDGSLWAMGQNNFGQLGDGTTTDRHLPVQILASNIIAVTAGSASSFFIKSDGTLWAMGLNDDGQLGDGTYAERHSPVQVVPLVIPQPRITNIKLVKFFRFFPVRTAYANLFLNGVNGQAGRTYFTLMSTDIAQPLERWTPVATNILSIDGAFSITNTVELPTASQVFFSLQVR